MQRCRTLLNTLCAPIKSAIRRPDIARRYQRLPSFSQFFSLSDYDANTKLFALEDGRSVASCLKVTPIPCEARPFEKMQEIALLLQGVLQHAVPLDAASPWILQIYVEDEPSLSHLEQAIERSFPSTPLFY